MSCMHILDVKETSGKGEIILVLQTGQVNIDQIYIYSFESLYGNFKDFFSLQV